MNQEDLRSVGELIEAGELTPVIDRTWKAWARRLRTMSTRTPSLAAAQATSLPA